MGKVTNTLFYSLTGGSVSKVNTKKQTQSHRDTEHLL